MRWFRLLPILAPTVERARRRAAATEAGRMAHERHSLLSSHRIVLMRYLSLCGSSVIERRRDERCECRDERDERCDHRANGHARSDV